MMAQKLATHILPNSATMIGVCVTAVGLVKIAEAHIGPSQVDVYFSIVALLFLASAIFAYVAIRFETRQRVSFILERIADVSFMGGLVALSLVAVLFAYEVV